MITKAQQKLIRSLEHKKYRQREGLFVAEGPKVVGDLTAAGFEAVMMFTDEDDVKRLSFLQHPQGVLGVFRIPETSALHTPLGSAVLHREEPLTLALDGIQDPGNLGTIIRIADWFGIDAIYCSPDTADAWAPKVVQATMGSIARVPIIYRDLDGLLDEAEAAGIPVYGTLLDGENIYEQELTAGGIILMGNEGNGISAPLRQRITRRLLIPDFHQGETADSLNVAIATAITCSEFRRRRN
jgi:TrmH family RNA methyltransferase